MKKFLGAASALLLLAGCTPPEEVATNVDPKIAAGAVKPDGRINADPALWVLRDADTTRSVSSTPASRT